MILIIVCFMLFVNSMSTLGWDNLKKHEDFIAEKSPFFELACKLVGGICAKSHSCPLGTRVAQTGLCPEQQKNGFECCRPRNRELNCCTQRRDCVPNTFDCSQFFLIKHMNENVFN